MGEAEDIVRKQQDDEHRRREAQKRREAASRLKSFNELIPVVVANLRRHNYELGDRTWLTIHPGGEKRLGWRLGWTTYGVTYILADGKFACTFGDKTEYRSPDSCCNEETLRKLESLAVCCSEHHPQAFVQNRWLEEDKPETLETPLWKFALCLTIFAFGSLGLLVLLAAVLRPH